MEKQHENGIPTQLNSLIAEIERKAFIRGQQSVLEAAQTAAGAPAKQLDDTEMTLTEAPTAKKAAPTKQKAPFGYKPDGTPRKRRWSQKAQAATNRSLAKARKQRALNLAAELKKANVKASKKVVRRSSKKTQKKK